jgi:hypothetical protein
MDSKHATPSHASVQPSAAGSELVQLRAAVEQLQKEKQQLGTKGEVGREVKGGKSRL